MIRPRALIVGLGVVVGIALLRHSRNTGPGRETSEGVLITDVNAYDRFSRRLLGRLFERVATDVATQAPRDARILEVGCGPGHLSMRLAADHRLDVTGIDLDPAMVDRARANAGTLGAIEHPPSFQVGDAASLPFPDGSFDLVVSTLSMHHWADQGTALNEITRVLTPGGHALIWDFGHGVWPLHTHVPDPTKRFHGSPLRLLSVTPWPWPWRLRLIQRFELAKAG